MKLKWAGLFFQNPPDGTWRSLKCIESKNRRHFDFKNFLIRCILDYAQRHLVDFWKKRPANFNFIWLEWNNYNSSKQIYIVWSCSLIFKLKSSQWCGHLLITSFLEFNYSCVWNYLYGLSIYLKNFYQSCQCKTLFCYL